MNSHHSQLQLSGRILSWWTIGACCAGLVACSGGDGLDPAGDATWLSPGTEFEGTEGDSPLSDGEAPADEDDPSLQADERGLETDDADIGLLEQALNGALEGTIEMGWNFVGWTLVTPVGGPCPQGTTRDRIEITSLYGAPATWTWVYENDATSCAANITTSVQNGHYDTFQWRIATRRANLAAGKPASQSSSPFGAGAERAVDGITNGNWYASSVTHTGFEAQPWWQVDFGVVKSIGKVVLFNRSDCCGERLSNFDILVSNGYDPNSGYNWTVAASLTGQAPPELAFPMSTSGRFVRVQLRGTNYLSLAEVQVLGP